jgi:hypothetical protein
MYFNYYKFDFFLGLIIGVSVVARVDLFCY